MIGIKSLFHSISSIKRDLGKEKYVSYESPLSAPASPIFASVYIALKKWGRK
jgi:hypothetical protein